MGQRDYLKKREKKRKKLRDTKSLAAETREMYLGIMKPKELEPQLVFLSIIPTGLGSMWKINHSLHKWHQRTEFSFLQFKTQLYQQAPY